MSTSPSPEPGPSSPIKPTIPEDDPITEELSRDDPQDSPRDKKDSNASSTLVQSSNLHSNVATINDPLTSAVDESNRFNRDSVRPELHEIWGSQPVGEIGKHKPREVLRVDRDYTGGELCQFWSGYPIELEGRVTPTQHLHFMNELNAVLASAHDPYKSIFDNTLAILTLYISTLLYKSHYEREIERFYKVIQRGNREVYNPVGLNVLDPRPVAFLFLEIEYY